MPLLEVTLKQEYVTQQTINRWTYRGSGVPAAVSFPFALAQAMGAIPNVGIYPLTGMMWAIALTQMTSVNFVELIVRDIYDPTEFYTVPFIEPLTGQYIAGEGAAPFVASGYRTNRTRLDVRRATKRFAGFPETEVGQGGIDGDFLTGQMTDLAAAMSDVLEYDDEGNTLQFAPCVLAKEKYQVPDSDPARFAYRYFGTEAEQLDHIMEGITWEPYNRVRSQTSRQFGRGQ